MNKIKKLAFATDHTAVGIRDEIIKYLKEMDYEIEEFILCKNKNYDYPDYAYKVAYAVVNRTVDKGILICGTGIGMSIAANKIRGIIAAVCWNENIAKLASQHNNANILCLGSRINSVSEICCMIKIFLSSFFEKRHTFRIKKIRDIEKQEYGKIGNNIVV
ncbi:MAG: ribose 5-phosphate isomerase B [Endomicrobium sp.]|jgi:ribose 5-phosphate isomerase B|nr:ribose 5-phosphate isomerase B [Endomicrobium sp.]